MRDTITIGTIAGLIGTIGMHITNSILKSFGIVKITTLQIASSLFLNWDQIDTIYGQLVGYINHFFIGAIVGVVIAFVYKFTGKDFFLVKGLGITGLSYLAALGFITPLLKSVPQIRNDPSSLFGHIIAYIVFALIASFIIYRYSKLTTS